MPRYPAYWNRLGLPARLAGSQPRQCPPYSPVRRIIPPPITQYTTPVTVDLGNDGMAPQVFFGGNVGFQDIYEDIYFDTYGITSSLSTSAETFVGPSSGGDVWSLDQCFVSTSVGPLDTSQCIVYVGPLPLAQYAVTGSIQGGSSQFGLGGVAVPFGWFIWALWTQGTAGAAANLRVTGVKTVLIN